MSPELKQFFAALQAWIDEGCPDGRIFSIHSGVCFNASIWSDERLDKELSSLLKKEFGDCLTPFNYITSQPSYFSELNKFTNPARLAWIRKQITGE